METKKQHRKPSNSVIKIEIDPDSVVADILSDWPETIPVFLKRHLNCVGCDMSPFDTVADVARIYKFDAADFLEELQTAITPGNADVNEAI